MADQGKVAKGIYRHLDTNGNGTGTKNANGDYSSAADDFYIEVPAGAIYRIERMIVTIKDLNFNADEYVLADGGLSNGISVFTTLTDGTTQDQDLCDGLPIKSTADWSRMCFDVNFLDYGSGDQIISVRWTFGKAGEPLRLHPGQKLVVRLNDSFTGLTSHYFLVQGVDERQQV